MSSSKVCDICKKPILPGSKYKTTNVQNFHRECFKCAQCGKQLEYEYCEANGKFYCSQDYDDLFAPKCDKCFKGITEEHIQYRGKKFHNTCFSCLRCGVQVDVDNFFRVEERGPYCEPCADILTGEASEAQLHQQQQYTQQTVVQPAETGHIELEEAVEVHPVETEVTEVQPVDIDEDDKEWMKEYEKEGRKDSDSEEEKAAEPPKGDGGLEQAQAALDELLSDMNI